jgi:hypothetical protein
MTRKEKMFHSLILSCLFSLLSWFTIDRFITKVSFWQYFFIEFILILSLKLFNFTKQRLNLEL